MTLPYGVVAPSKPVSPGAQGVNSQRDRRFSDTFFDIHKSARFPRGRPWTGEREYAATPEQGHQPGFISGDLQPGEYVTDAAGICDRQATLATAWHAPWTPLAKYFKFNYQRKQISFDYVRMERDEKESLDRYFQAAAKMSGANGWGAIEYGKMPSYQITAILGEPTPYLRIAQAARAGDPWLLGHIDEPNDELAQILGQVHSGTGLYLPTTVKEPVVTVEKVLATAPTDLNAMIAAAVAQALAQQEAEKKAAHGAKVKAGMAKRANSTKADRMTA